MIENGQLFEEFDSFNALDNLSDLPVSEDTLGAYFEGNMDPAQFIEINSMIDSDSNLSAIVEGVQQKDNCSDISFCGNNLEDSPDLSNFELPEIETGSFSMPHFTEIKVPHFGEGHTSMLQKHPEIIEKYFDDEVIDFENIESLDTDDPIGEDINNLDL